MICAHFPALGRWQRHALAMLLAACAASACAADLPAPPPEDKLARARAHIARQRWPEAIEALRQVEDGRSNADWHNLMGFSLRKQQPPDYSGAERHYNEALRIEPQHRGALEYSGELYLLTGQLARAEARLAELDEACLFSCPEYADLKKAIERHKAGR